VSPDDDRIHRDFYPVDTDAPVPLRYSVILRVAASGLGPTRPAVLEVGPERPKISRYVTEGLRLSPDQYVCVEYSDLSAKALEQSGYTVHVLDVSSQDLPFEPSSFDLVIASEVLEHLLNPERFLKGCARILKPEGRIICTTPNLASWLNRLLLFAGIQPIYTETGSEWVFGRGPFVGPSRPVGHVHVLTLRALKELFGFCGFDVLEVRGTPSEELGRTGAFPRWLDALFARTPTLASNLLIAGRIKLGQPHSTGGQP
jgi:SAM-dependent methyltransferase